MMEAGSQADLGQPGHHADALILSHEAVVDMEELELVRPQCFFEKHGGDGGINSTRRQEEHHPLPHLFADGGGALPDLVANRPVLPGAADSEDKVAQNPFPD